MASGARKTNGTNGTTDKARLQRAIPSGDTFYVRHALVYVPELHVRADRPRVAALARAIQREEQLAPVLVERGGPSGYIFTLVDGARVMAAYEHLGWTDRELLVRVVHGSRDPLARVVTYWTLHTERAPLSLLDQARCVHALLSGTYFTLPGERGRTHDVPSIAALLGVTRRRVRSLLRVQRRLHADVVRAVQSARENGMMVPASLLLTMTDKTRDDDADDVRLERQTEILTQWTDKRLAVRSAREMRRTRQDRQVRRDVNDVSGANEAPR